MEERIIREFTLRNLICLLAYHFFEFPGIIYWNREEFLDKEKVKELLFDFGVHQDFIRHAGDESSQVDSLAEPFLAHNLVDFSQRNDIFTLKAFPSSHALFVLPL